ncbi:MAG: histidine kinase [Saprospiraceae bacterium]
MPFKETRVIILIGFYLFSAFAFQCWGQNYEYIQYTTKDGLPSNYVYGVVEDDEGYIWAYTENGLSKFDGYTFQNYTTKDGLPGNDVTYAEKDVKGIIWLNIHQQGIAYLYKDSIQQIQAIDSSDLQFRGLFYNYPIYYNSTLKNYCTVEPVVPYLFECFYPTSDTSNYVLDSLSKINSVPFSFKWPTGMFTFIQDSVFILRNQNVHKTVSFKGYPINLFGRYYKHLTGTNSFLFGNFIGELLIVNFDTGKIRNLNLDQFQLFPEAYVYSSILQSTFIINTDVGFLEFDFEGNLLRKFTLDQLSDQYSLLRAFKDSKGNLWVGSRQGGLFLLPRQFLTTTLLNSTDNEKNSFEYFYVLENGQVLCITDHSGIFLYQNDRLEKIISSSNKRFRSIQNTSIGLFLYDGTSGRVLKNEHNSWKNDDIQDVFKNAKVLTDGKLEKYIGSKFEDYGGRRNLLYLPGKSIFFQALSNRFDIIQISENGQHEIRRVPHISNVLFHHEEQDLILSGNNQGLFNYQGDDFIPFLRKYGALKNINAIEGSGDDLWINTEDNGIYHYQFVDKKLTKLFQTSSVRKIKEDGDHRLLIVTNSGVKIISKYQPTSSPISVFTTLDGLASNDIRDIHRIGDSVLLVATFDGVHKIDRRQKRSVLLAPEALSLQTFKINNQAYSFDSLPPFTYRQNNLDVSFQLQDYASNGQIKYSFKLTPIEEKWRTTSERNVSYPFLAPGKYTFHLKAQNAYGQEVEILPISFKVQEPFWQRFWFLILLGAILVSGLILLIRYRDELQKVKLAEEKRLNQRMTQLELSAFRAQMNPHFVFNALGSIQYFIQNKDLELADDYLAKFAKLMRMYLDSSKEKMIPLQRELNLLGIYTDLEKMRFEDNFSVNIVKDPDLDENDYYLPSMIIQPLIENAINHGLENRRDGKGRLEVIFQTEQEHLVCYINDNGIGRANAVKYRNKGHQPRGLELIKEKIQTLQNSGIAKIDIQISDWNPSHPAFPGTQVKLVIENDDENED